MPNCKDITPFPCERDSPPAMHSAINSKPVTASFEDGDDKGNIRNHTCFSV